MAAMESGQPNSLQSLLQSCLVDIFIALILLSTFWHFLKQVPFQSAIAPRLHEHQQVAPRSFLGWTVLAWRKRHRLDDAPPDVQVVLRFCAVGFKFSMCGALLACVLSPLYAASSRVGVSSLDRLSLSNLQSKSTMSVAVLAAYILAGVYMWLMLGEWRNFVFLRRAHLVARAQGICGIGAAQAEHSVLVEDIPPRATTDIQVLDFFIRLFGEQVVSFCVLHPDVRTSDDPRHHAQPRQVSADGGAQVPSVSSFQEQVNSELAQTSPGFSASFQRDGVSLTAEPRRYLLESAFEAREDCYHRTLQSFRAVGDAACGRSKGTTALVTLNSLAVSTMIQFRQLAHEGWLTFPAPDADDLIWCNVAVPFPQQRIRQLISQSLCILGILFWSVPVAAIQAWTTVEAPVLFAEYLPSVSLMLLLCILPNFFEFLAVRYECRKTKSGVRHIVLWRTLLYQLATIYLTVLSGSLWSQLKLAADNPRNLIQILGWQVPVMGTYFMIYVANKTCIVLPMLLLQPARLFKELWQRRWPRERQGSQKAYCNIPKEVANMALVLTIGQAYAVVSPLIMFFCMLYFGLAYLVYLWLFLHVNSPDSDGTGGLWNDLFNGSMIGMIFGTMTLAGMVSFSCSPASAEFSATLLLAALFVLFWIYCDRTYRCRSRMLTVADAVEIDRSSSITGMPAFSTDYYVRPDLNQEGEAASATSFAANAF
eukprot:TRINITY_DN109668_c0_g1_i1.p1 TRINITY_DN109668_c0_g1~~TRINITY_DN109668_c0_g1_i1.p1  ORF type:complete len:707 (-),score=97.86 TRINITY_DN109668_c0_g1_i1:172-2292(-)